MSLDVKYQGRKVGTLSLAPDNATTQFTYDDDFIETQIPLAPLTMPLVANKNYTFPLINQRTFKGLPGMMADSLPDFFGNAVLGKWFSATPEKLVKITPLERLQLVGSRGIGALEYYPSQAHEEAGHNRNIHLEGLTREAELLLIQQTEDEIPDIYELNSSANSMFETLFQVGTSAGGAYPKALLAFNKDKTKVCSGHSAIPEDFTHHLIKFDGVREEADPQKRRFGPRGFGVMEYLYYLMATKAGIDMAPCFLLENGNRRHFVTQRFDREGSKTRFHTQTYTAINHVNYHAIGYYSYEMLFDTAIELRLSGRDLLNLFRRAVFNHVATNHDDHSKNFSFILKNNEWHLSPAYDVVFGYAPETPWGDKHWMRLNNKRSGHNRADLHSLANNYLPEISSSEIDVIVDEVIEVVSHWDTLAREFEMPKELASVISDNIKIENYL